MAAVLANACGEICSGTCEVLGHACRLPCKACDAICSGCGNVCETACFTLGRLCSSPFSIYVTVATVFNLPVVYMGLTSGIPNGMVCHGSKWLIIDMVFAIVNIAAAVYMAIVVVKQDEPTYDIEANNSSSNKNKKPTTAFGRAGHLLCYDPWMALYILSLLGFFVWLWTGGIWSLNGNLYQNCSEDNGAGGKVAIALGFGWAFFFFGVGALCISLCCSFCYGGNSNNSNHYGLYQDTTTGTANTYGTTTASGTSNNTKTGSGGIGGGFFGGKSSSKTNPPTVAAAPAPSKPSSSPPMAQAVLF